MKVAIYARVSTEKQERQETIQSQLEALRDHATEKKYLIVKEYVDEGYSGELLDRPALDNLRDDARNKSFEAILVYCPDRLSRKFIYLGLVEEELKKEEIKLIFLNRPDSKETPEENLLTGIQGLIAEYEKAKILERTRRGRLHKVKNGILVGSIPPYGYRYVKADRDKNIPGHYEIVESEAQTVRLIFDMFVNQKLSIRDIARQLTRKGIPPREGYKWHTSSLHRIIRNETYIGVTYWNKYYSFETQKPRTQKYRRTKNTGRKLRPRDQWITLKLPADLMLIDEKTFQLAQQQLKRNSNLSMRNAKRTYLLSGLTKCGFCGSPFYGTPCHGKYYYRCGNRQRTFPEPRTCKEATMLKADDLETLVWDTFCDMIRNPEIILQQVERIRQEALKQANTLKADLDALDAKLNAISKEEARLLDAYREDIIDKDQLKTQMAKVKEKQDEITNKRQELLNNQERLKSKVFSKENLTALCELLSENLKAVGNDAQMKRKILTLAINSITIKGKDVRIRSIVPVPPPQDVALRPQLPDDGPAGKRQDHARQAHPDHHACAGDRRGAGGDQDPLGDGKTPRAHRDHRDPPVPRAAPQSLQRCHGRRRKLPASGGDLACPPGSALPR